MVPLFLKTIVYVLFSNVYVNPLPLNGIVGIGGVGIRVCLL
jgi:hypothetical protein